MKSIFKKILAGMLFVATLVPFGTCSVSAASSASKLSETVDKRTPIVTYASPASGASKVYAYSNAELEERLSGYYINSYTEEIVVTDITADGKAVKVNYLNDNGKVRTKWYRYEDIFGLTKIDVDEFSPAKKVSVYRMKSKSAVTSYGTIYAGGTCWQLGTHKIGSKTYYTVIYKLSDPVTLNGVSNVKYKMGLTSANNVSSSQSTNKVTTKFSCPVLDKKIANNISMAFAGYAPYRDAPNTYHLGTDYTVRLAWEDADPDLSGYNLNICAFGDGKVVDCGKQKGNGNYVIISHTIATSSGKTKTIYSFYGHLKSYSAKIGQTVKAGDVIGVMGRTGSSAGANIHLHFAVTDKLVKDGGIAGYRTSFKGNSTTWNGMTFYNPEYVIKNDKLPG